MRCRLGYVFSLCICLIAGNAVAKDTAKKFFADFENVEKSEFAQKLLAHANASYAKGKGKDGSNCVRIAYVGYEKGSKRTSRHYDLGFSLQTAVLEFDVKFEQDFQWVKGGKLHGLGPDKPVTGGKEMSPGSWSSRIMFLKSGGCCTYLYNQTKATKYGETVSTKKSVFQAGKWHRVKMETKVNDLGKANGYTKVWIDGKLLLEHNKVMFRKAGGDETLIRRLLFSTFHGGASPSWAPKDKERKYTTVYALFDNFSVEGQ